jgi:hypothetical protein
MLILAIVLAVIPAAFVSFIIEPVPTMLIPVGIAMLPLAFRAPRDQAAARIIAFTLLLLFCFIGGFSVGVFFLPSAIAMIVAAALASRSADKQRLSIPRT